MNNWHWQRGIEGTGPQLSLMGAQGSTGQQKAPWEKVTKEEIEAWEKDSERRKAPKIDQPIRGKSDAQKAAENKAILEKLKEASESVKRSKWEAHKKRIAAEKPSEIEPGNWVDSNGYPVDESGARPDRLGSRKLVSQMRHAPYDEPLTLREQEKRAIVEKMERQIERAMFEAINGKRVA